MLETPKDDLAVRLIKARTKKGMTAKALGFDLNMPNTIWRIEQGRVKRIHADTIIKLCNILDISADYLLGLKEEMK